MRNLTAPTLITSLLFSCSQKEEKAPPVDVPKTEQEIMEQTLDDKERLDKAKQIYAMLPSLMETSIILKESGANYFASNLKDPNKSYDYQTSLSQSINLGGYGTNLSFAAAYGKENDVVSFFAAVKVLSDKLNISNAFTEKLMNDVEKNINNQTELLRLISDAYWSANNDLTASERAATSTLVFTGGWLEAMYIAVQLVNNDISQTQIIEKIGQQKYTLELLNSLLESAKGDENVALVYQDFQPLVDAFGKLEYTGESQDITDPVTGEVKEGILKSVIIKEENLSEITELVQALRDKYNNLS